MPSIIAKDRDLVKDGQIDGQEPEGEDVGGKGQREGN